MFHKAFHFFRQKFLVPRFAGPHRKHLPAQRRDRFKGFMIALAIAGDLLLPELDVGRGKFGSCAALMSMPEAPVHQNDFLVPGQDNIGSAWKLLVM